jgi:hypothetical protein
VPFNNVIKLPHTGTGAAATRGAAIMKCSM